MGNQMASWFGVAVQTQIIILLHVRSFAQTQAVSDMS